MPVFDFICGQCQIVIQDVWMSNYRDAQGLTTVEMECPTPGCSGVPQRCPSAPNVKVAGGTPKFHP